MARKSIFEMEASTIIDALVAKAERKGRTREEVLELMTWLTGYRNEDIDVQVARGIDYATFFREAPEMNPKRKAITGTICGIRVEAIEDPLMQDMRYLDKLVDELASGKAMDKIKRAGDEPTTIDAYIALQPEAIQPILNKVRETLRGALPDAEEIISWGMPTYKKKHNIIHFAAAKKHVGLFPGAEAVTHFAESLTEYQTSKGTIRFPYKDEIPYALIRTIALWCAGDAE